MEKCSIDSGDGFGLSVSKGTKLMMNHCQILHSKTAVQTKNLSELDINDCIIQHSRSSIIVMRGTKANIRRCSISDAIEGIVFYHAEDIDTVEDQLTMEDCVISRMNNNGLSIYGDIAPVVKNCIILHCKSTGVNVVNDSSVTKRPAIFEKCVIEETEGFNVFISNTSPIFRDCQILNAHGKISSIRNYPLLIEKGINVTGSNIFVIFDSSPQFIECTISSKFKPEIAHFVGVGYRAKASFEKCIFDGEGIRSPSLAFFFESSGMVKNCILKNSAMTEAITVLSQAQVTFDNSFFENNYAGIMCGNEGTANINNCTFTNNTFGVVGTETGTLYSSKSRFDGNLQASIFMEEQARGTFENNEILNGKKYGIAIRSEEPIAFRSNIFKNNGTNWLIQCSGKQLQRIDNEPNE